LCATVVHSAMYTHMNRPNSCLLVRFSLLGLFCVIVYLCMRAFVVLDLVSSELFQEIGSKEHLRNYLFCVEWDVKP